MIGLDALMYWSPPNPDQLSPLRSTDSIGIHIFNRYPQSLTVILGQYIDLNAFMYGQTSKGNHTWVFQQNAFSAVYASLILIGVDANSSL